MDDHYADDIGRCFCSKHHRAACHECCLDFEPINEMAEINAGLRAPKTEFDELAEEYWALRAGLDFFAQNRDLHSPAARQQVDQMKQVQRKMDLMRQQGQSQPLDAALNKEKEKHVQRQASLAGLTQAWAKENPGQQVFEMGGPDTQRLFDQFVKPPETKANRADSYTCSFCRKTGATKMKMCARCKKVGYCSKECQKSAWKAHKKECVAVEKEPRDLHLVWKQVEAKGGEPFEGRSLEVKAIHESQSSRVRQEFACSDRDGVIRKVAAFTDDGTIPGLTHGATLRWKNPRIFHFPDGTSGAKIEQTDLVNITVKPLSEG